MSDLQDLLLTNKQNTKGRIVNTLCYHLYKKKEKISMNFFEHTKNISERKHKKLMHWLPLERNEWLVNGRKKETFSLLT